MSRNRDRQRANRTAAGTEADIFRVPPWAVAAAAVVLVLIVADVHWHGPLFDLDHRIETRARHWDLRHHRPARWSLTIGVYFGQRGVVLVGAAILALWLSWRSRTIEPVLRLIVAVVSLAVVVYSFKFGLARNAPIQDAQGLPAGRGQSFPSGHIANAILVWGWADWSLARFSASVPAPFRRAIRIGWMVAPIAVFGSMTLLDYHWFTDFVGGAAVGVILLALTVDARWARLASWIDTRPARRGAV